MGGKGIEWHTALANTANNFKNNFLMKLRIINENHFFTTPLYMAVVTAEEETSPFQMIYNLFDLIKYAIEHNMSNKVIDSSQIVHYG